MITLFDLTRLAQLYPAGSLNNPVYAFGGGTAVQCWLNNSTNDRKHHDIDIFAFNPAFLKSILKANLDHSVLFFGGSTRDNTVAYFPNLAIQLQISMGSYFDSEITPTTDDVRSINIDNTLLLALSPEFIAVSKLSYPNVHRSFDFQDVLALNQCGCLQNPEYLSKLLSQTSLGKLIGAQDILDLRTEDDLQALVDSIHHRLIRRFLYWDRVNVDVLNPFQLFVLLDMGDELFHLPTEILQFIDTMLAGVVLSEHELQTAKLGLHLLTVGIPSQSLNVLQNSDFQVTVNRGLALIPKRPTAWLILSKTVFMTLQELTHLDDLVGGELRPVFNPAIILSVVQRIFINDKSRFSLLASVRSLYCDLLQTGRISNFDYVNSLHQLLTAPDHELSQAGKRNQSE